MAGLLLSNVRKATVAELPALRRLYRLVDQEHAEFEPSLSRGRSAQEREALLHVALHDPASRLAVVVEGQHVVGFALSSFRRERPDVVIEAIVIDPDARRRGHGRALIEDLQAWMKSKGGRYVELDVYDFNGDAVAFYESLGFISFSRRLRRAQPIG